MKISNFQNNKTIRYTLYAIRRQVGFTLIELLVVMIVFVTVGSIIGSILFTTLRGTNKSNVLINVKQNGTTVMAQIEKTIRNSRKFEGVNTSDNNNTYIQNCAVPLPGAGTSPAPTTTPFPYQYLKVSSFPDAATSNITVTTFSCTGSGPYTLSVQSASSIPSLTTTPTPTSVALLNNTVSVNSCYFTCTQQNLADSPVIGVHFSVSQKNSPGVTPNAENQAAISFDTAIAMRNYGR